jgi:hypothetical protein
MFLMAFLEAFWMASGPEACFDWANPRPPRSFPATTNAEKWATFPFVVWFLTTRIFINRVVNLDSMSVAYLREGKNAIDISARLERNGFDRAFRCVDHKLNRSVMTSTLDQLKQFSTVVADTGDFNGLPASMLML